MNKNKNNALEEAKKRLQQRFPGIEKRLQAAKENSEDEPDHLISGIGLNELEIKRLIKEQENKGSTQ